MVAYITLTHLEMLKCVQLFLTKIDYNEKPCLSKYPFFFPSLLRKLREKSKKKKKILSRYIDFETQYKC